MNFIGVFDHVVHVFRLRKSGWRAGVGGRVVHRGHGKLEWADVWYKEWMEDGSRRTCGTKSGWRAGVDGRVVQRGHGELE